LFVFIELELETEVKIARQMKSTANNTPGRARKTNLRCLFTGGSKLESFWLLPGGGNFEEFGILISRSSSPEIDFG